jgi:hypothetical protein
MSEAGFRICARTIGVELKIAALIADCDKALADPRRRGDERWRARVEDQRQRLLAPDLRTIVALATCLAEDTPGLALLVAAAMKELAAADPDLRCFERRLLNAGHVRPLEDSTTDPVAA